ncbi:hypothetical protein BY996DRAFT_1084851 [Phakopsora pachyrhizi]|nr:hypothetical protein BY996DRAFT_1084851 [Phakopsora pachyrhizi]
MAESRWESKRQAWLTPRSFTTPSPADEDRTRNKETIAKISEAVETYDRQVVAGGHTGKSILVINRLAKMLKEPNKHYRQPIPLPLAISVLYRSWFHDGTIPDQYMSHGPENQNSDEQTVSKDV